MISHSGRGIALGNKSNIRLLLFDTASCACEVWCIFGSAFVQLKPIQQLIALCVDELM